MMKIKKLFLLSFCYPYVFSSLSWYCVDLEDSLYSPVRSLKTVMNTDNLWITSLQNRPLRFNCNAKVTKHWFWNKVLYHLQSLSFISSLKTRRCLLRTGLCQVDLTSKKHYEQRSLKWVLMKHLFASLLLIVLWDITSLQNLIRFI